MSIKSCILNSLDDVKLKIESNLDDIKMEERDESELCKMFAIEIENKILELVKLYNELCEIRQSWGKNEIN